MVSGGGQNSSSISGGGSEHSVRFFLLREFDMHGSAEALLFSLIPATLLVAGGVLVAALMMGVAQTVHFKQ